MTSNEQGITSYPSAAIPSTSEGSCNGIEGILSITHHSETMLEQQKKATNKRNFCHLSNLNISWQDFLNAKLNYFSILFKLVSCQLIEWIWNFAELAKCMESGSHRYCIESVQQLHCSEVISLQIDHETPRNRIHFAFVSCGKGLPGGLKLLHTRQHKLKTTSSQ